MKKQKLKVNLIKEIQKDNDFMKDVDKFIEATTNNVFKLKDLE